MRCPVTAPGLMKSLWPSLIPLQPQGPSRCFSQKPRSLLSQGLSTGCPICLGLSSLTHLHGSPSPLSGLIRRTATSHLDKPQCCYYFIFLLSFHHSLTQQLANDSLRFCKWRFYHHTAMPVYYVLCLWLIIYYDRRLSSCNRDGLIPSLKYLRCCLPFTYINMVSLNYRVDCLLPPTKMSTPLNRDFCLLCSLGSSVPRKVPAHRGHSMKVCWMNVWSTGPENLMLW